MEGLYEWVRNIVYYLIFITVVSSLLPNHKYEKYMKLFAGIVCVLLVLKPLTTGLRLDDKLAYYFESISFQKETDDLKTKLSGMEEERLSSMVSQYEEAVAMDLERMVMEQELYPENIKVTIETDQSSEDFGKVTQVAMILTDALPKETVGMEAIVPIEPVKIDAESQAGARQTERKEETAKIQSLRTKIAEYYGLEAQKIEIQMG